MPGSLAGLRPYVLSALLVAGATLAGIPVHWFIAPTNIVMLYLAAVVGAALFLGRGPSILAAVMSVLAFDFFMVPPFFTFAVNDSEYVITFFGLLIVGLVVSKLVSDVRHRAREALRKERQTQALFELSRDLGTTRTLDQAAQTILLHAERTFAAPAALSLFEADGTRGFPSDNKECNGMAVPLLASDNALGTLALGRSSFDDSSHFQLLEAFGLLGAMAVERVRLSEKARNLEVLEAREKIQSALLNSISHELRTPLSSIEGVLSTLVESTLKGDAMHLAPEMRRELVETALAEARRLNQLVGNLLSMTRLEAGGLSLHREITDLQDLVGDVLRQIEDRTGYRTFDVRIPDDLPPVRLDFVLAAQALGNVIDNAVKYGAPSSPIVITAAAHDERIVVSVADSGPGVPEGDLEKIFDKFHRLNTPGNPGGLGLGLPIARGLVEAHGGTIQAAPNPSGGLIVSFSLPTEEEGRGP